MPTDKFEELKSQIEESLKENYGEDVQVAIVGQPNAGKGSLKNKLVRNNNAHVGVVDGHTSTQDKWRGGAIIEDLAGIGTPSYPSAKEFFEKFNVHKYDAIIFVIETQLRDVDVALFKLIKDNGKPCIIVRNKSDNIWQDGKSYEDLKKEIAEEICRKLQSYEQVIFISCRTDVGLQDVEKAIESALPHAKAVRWMLNAKARTEEQLLLKRQSCQLNLLGVVAAAAGNGLNPNPIAGIAIDQGLMFKFFSDVRSIYNLDNEVLLTLSAELQVEVTANAKFLIISIIREMNEAAIDTVARESLKEIAEEAAERGSIELVKRSNQLVKYIPAIGPVISVSVAACIALVSGKDYINKCHEAAKEIMLHELKRRQPGV